LVYCCKNKIVDTPLHWQLKGRQHQPNTK